MIKRIISVALAVLMVLAMGAIAVSAAEVSDANAGAEVSNSAGADTSSSASGAGNLIYFDTDGWKNFSTVFCHIWVRGGDSFFDWQQKKEQCKKVSGTVYSYDLSNLSGSSYVSGGLQSGKDYCVIFSNNIGAQTYDTTFGTACIGDTAKMTGNSVENPVDSEKKAFEAVWTKNSSSYGPHLAITSIGNIVGNKLCPNENGLEVIGDWIPTYYKSPNVNAVDALAKAYPKFGVKTIEDIEAIYAYVVSKATGEDEAEILDQLEKAFAKAYPSAKETKLDKEDIEKAKKDAQDIKSGKKTVNSVAGNTSSGNSGSGSASAGSSSSGSTSTNSSGAGSDGQEDMIFVVLAGVMLTAAGVMFVSRKKREE